MHISYDIKPEDTRFLVLKIEEEPWAICSKTFFFKHIKNLERCQTMQELALYWEEAQKKAAENYILWLLKRKNYFSQELRKKLKQRHYTQEVIEHAVEKFQRLGYVNDESETERFILRESKKGRGPRLIALKLRAAGIKTTVDIDQKEIMRTLLKTRLRRYNLQDPKDKQKAARALQQRGFDLELISAVIYKE